jgi:hypothetical protein
VSGGKLLPREIAAALRALRRHADAVFPDIPVPFEYDEINDAIDEEIESARRDLHDWAVAQGYTMVDELSEG